MGDDASKKKKGKFRLPPRSALLRRAKAKPYLLKRCPYLPCHEPLETCNMCYCLFYPCNDPRRGSPKVIDETRSVWSCMECDWVHRQQRQLELNEFIAFEESNGVNLDEVSSEELYQKFIEYLNRD